MTVQKRWESDIFEKQLAPKDLKKPSSNVVKIKVQAGGLIDCLKRMQNKLILHTLFQDSHIVRRVDHKLGLFCPKSYRLFLFLNLKRSGDIKFVLGTPFGQVHFVTVGSPKSLQRILLGFSQIQIIAFHFPIDVIEIEKWTW